MDQTLDWDQVRVFLAAERAGSLRGASDQLGVNHATVSRAIQGLEVTLGARLFDRSSGGLVLTQPGEMLLSHAEAMERQTISLRRQMAGLDDDPSGVVRVSVPPSFVNALIQIIMPGFSEAYPEIDIQLIATNRLSNLGRLEADVSIRSAFEVDDDVVGRRVLRYVVGAFATPDYLAKHPDLEIGDGTGATWVGWGEARDWVKDSPFPKATARHRFPEVFMQIEGAVQGLGMVYIPAFLGDADPRLVRIPGVPVKPNRSIWILLHSDLRKTARVRAFVDYVAAAIRERREMFTR